MYECVRPTDRSIDFTWQPKPTTGTHDPTEDASSALLLFKKFRNTTTQHILTCQEVLLRSPRTPSFSQQHQIVDGVSMGRDYDVRAVNLHAQKLQAEAEARQAEAAAAAEKAAAATAAAKAAAAGNKSTDAKAEGSEAEAGSASESAPADNANANAGAEAEADPKST